MTRGPGDGRLEADVVLRSRNEASRIAATLESLFRQRGVRFRALCVDSGSDDGTLELLARWPVTVVRMAAESFTYGLALNRGAALGDAEFLACLNADAEPADDRWLLELLRPFVEDPRVAATYSRQIPRSGAHLTVLRDYAWAFGERAPAADPPFFSMVASAFRRALWREHPFWEGAGAGDDMEWVRWAIGRGLRTAYAPASRVLHSHDYSGLEHYRKLAREQRMHVELFGARDQWSPPATLRRLVGDLARDADWARRHRRWSSLPSAAWFRGMQAAGRLQGWAAATQRLRGPACPAAPRAGVDRR